MQSIDTRRLGLGTITSQSGPATHRQDLQLRVMKAGHCSEGRCLKLPSKRTNCVRTPHMSAPHPIGVDSGGVPFDVEGQEETLID